MRNLMFGGAIALMLAFPLAALARPASSAPVTPPTAQTAPMQPSTQTSASAATPATPAAPSSYTDAQLRAFATASAEIEPINRGVSGSAAAEQQTQISAILQRNNIDAATYNAIAAQAHSDHALAARIGALGTASGHH